MMGASSSAMHAQSSRGIKTKSRTRHNQQLLREMSSASNSEVDAKVTLGQDQTQEEKSHPEPVHSKDGSFKTIKKFDDALARLGLHEHAVKSAKNIMKKTEHLKGQLLDVLNTVACMRTGTAEEISHMLALMEADFFEVSFEKRVIIGDFLKEVDFPLVAFQKYKQLLKEFNLENITESFAFMNETSQVAVGIRGHWWNYSDCSSSFASSLVTHGIVEEAVQDVKNLIGSDMKTIVHSFVFESAIGILHNVAKIQSHRQAFRDLKLVAILGNFLNYENAPKITMLVLLTLALIIDENQTDLLFSHESSFDLLITLARRSWKKPDRRYDGFSLEELVLGLKGLSKNDKVKRLLVDKNILSLVSEILESGNEDEQEIAAKLLWELSFDSTNKDIIQENSVIMSTLTTLSSNSGKVAQNAQGALWVLRMDGTKVKPSKKKVEMEKSAIEGKASSTRHGHVMISYNWSDQKQLIEVKESLKQNGLSVWMDIDNISGSTLQAMAEAVEGSSVVLVCMSEKYKESMNCRSEAEYAFSLKKPIIPLLMQDSYKPDGWLGILLGTKLFFDFSGRFSFDAKISELQKELDGCGISATADSDVPDGPIVKKSAPLVGKGLSRNQNMTEVNVKAWVLEHQLEKIPLFSSMKADHLNFLKKISVKAPEFYYSFLLDLLHQKITMEDLNSLMHVTDAIGKLPS